MIRNLQSLAEAGKDCSTNMHTLMFTWFIADSKLCSFEGMRACACSRLLCIAGLLAAHLGDLTHPDNQLRQWLRSIIRCTHTHTQMHGLHNNQPVIVFGGGGCSHFRSFWTSNTHMHWDVATMPTGTHLRGWVMGDTSGRSLSQLTLTGWSILLCACYVVGKSSAWIILIIMK